MSQFEIALKSNNILCCVGVGFSSLMPIPSLAWIVDVLNNILILVPVFAKSYQGKQIPH